ncbi:MAG: HAD family phosphatase [Ardenticatenaceae bacterium]|nr:HAD family phosphatase [Ardenticatenaceae bacterium]
MIQAVIFDLDGTLVQTEKLKALSYARAAVDLCPYTLREDEVIEAFKDVVGLSRRDVATRLVKRFNLADNAAGHMAEFGVSTPWQAFVQIRLAHYNKMLADPEVIRSNQWPHNMNLLERMRQEGCRVGLATMSHCEQVTRVLQILELSTAFDIVATRDDVDRGKPSPEIYQLVLAELGVQPDDALAIEDSPSGVEAAVAAGMHCIAVSTPFTGQQLHERNLIEDRWIVDDPADLMRVVDQKFQALN